MNGVDFLALVLARVFKRKARDARRSLLGDDLQALHHARHHFVLESRIKALSIFANNHQVHIRIARRNMRQIAHRPEVRVKLKLLAQLHVDAGKASANRRSDRPLQRHMRAFNGFGQLFGNVFVVFLERLGARLHRFPFELEASGFQNTDDCLSDFRADAVAGDESNFVGHKQFE